MQTMDTEAYKMPHNKYDRNYHEMTAKTRQLFVGFQLSFLIKKLLCKFGKTTILDDLHQGE